MKQLNQKGFTLVEGLLVVIALAAIVGVGFYVYNSKQDQPEAKTVSTSSPQKTESKAPEKKYLKIPELGIKFELNDTIDDAYYKIDGSLAYLSVHYFDNLKGFEGCQASGGTKGLGVISKAKVGEDDGFGSPWTEAQLTERGGVKVDDAYYLFTPQSHTACYDQNTISQDNPDAQKIGEYKNSFAEQLKTATKL